MSCREHRQRRVARRTLGSFLAIPFFLLSIAAFLVAGCLQLFFSVRLRNTTLASVQQRVATEAQKAVSAFVHEKVSVLESALWIASPHALSASAQQDLLSGLLGRDPAIRRILLLDGSGRVTALVSRRSAAEAGKGESRRWREAYVHTGVDGTYFSPVYVDKASGEPLFLVALPVRDVLGAYHGALLTPGAMNVGV